MNMGVGGTQKRVGERGRVIVMEQEGGRIGTNA